MAQKDIKKLLEEATYFLSRQRLDEAEEIYMNVLECDSKNMTALSNLGYIKYFQNQFQKGLGFCERALKIKPDDPILIREKVFISLNWECWKKELTF